MVDKLGWGEAQMTKRLVVIASVVVLFAVSVLAVYQFGKPNTTTPAPQAGGAPPRQGAPSTAPPRAAGEQKRLMVWLTGYSWQDNTPPGSSVVGEPVLHTQAGGTGTWTDPITVAVPGHQGDMDWAPGTRFYLPTVQRYVMVEDFGAAEPPSGADTHLDMWIGGQDGTQKATDDCEDNLTGDVPSILNPPNTDQVMAGSIFAGANMQHPAANNHSTYNSNSDHGGH